MRIKTGLRTLCLAVTVAALTSCSANGTTLPGTSAEESAGSSVSALASASAGTPAATPAETQTPTASAPSGSAAATAQITLSPAALDIAAGKSIRLTAAGGDSSAIEWSTSNLAVVSVSSDGTVKALKAGESMITAKAGECSAACRVTVTKSGQTLAYPDDPGPVGKDGDRKGTGGQGDNIPLLIPDDQTAIDLSDVDKGDYSWQFIIDDRFDTKLTVPNTDFSYIANYHIALDARKAGGSTLTGDYKGTMKMEMAIDKASFLKAMKKMGLDAQDEQSVIQVQTIPVQFKVVPYQIDQVNQAKYQYAPSGTVPLAQLTQMPAMAISFVKTSTSGSLFKQYAKNQGITEEQVRQKYIDQVPMKRGCTYEDVANVMVFLASSDSSYMTGQAINVTGGQEMK